MINEWRERMPPDTEFFKLIISWETGDALVARIFDCEQDALAAVKTAYARALSKYRVDDVELSAAGRQLQFKKKDGELVQLYIRRI